MWNLFHNVKMKNDILFLQDKDILKAITKELQ